MVWLKCPHCATFQRLLQYASGDAVCCAACGESFRPKRAGDTASAHAATEITATAPVATTHGQQPGYVVVADEESAPLPQRRKPSMQEDDFEPAEAGGSSLVHYWPLAAVGVFGLLGLCGLIFIAILWSKSPDSTAETGSAASSSEVTPAHTPPSAKAMAGLIAYWSFDEGTGAKAADSSGQHHDATLEGTAWTDGIRGKALRVYGGTTCADFGDSPVFNFGDGAAFTFAGWLKTNQRDGTILSQRNSHDGAPVIDILIERGTLHVEVRPDGNEWQGPVVATNRTPLSDGQWHHFALIRDKNGGIQAFVDGASEGRATGDADGPITTDLRSVGLERYWLNHPSIHTSSFDGAIDEVCIFNRALTAQEIRTLAGR
jgi:hypothetical protein